MSWGVNFVNIDSVNEGMISFYEELGVSFRRRPVPHEATFLEIREKGWCY
jgi:hypothetical protein